MQVDVTAETEGRAEQGEAVPVLIHYDGRQARLLA